MELVRKARSLATRLHGFQSYGDDEPYDYHLENAANTLKFFGITEENMIAAAWLHDTIEDTYLDYQKIVKLFNREIADMVYCATDELGKNREEKHLKTYPKIKGDIKGTQLKLADRIANIKHSYYSTSSRNKFDMYKKEHAEFELGIRCKETEPIVTTRMWEYLEDVFKRDVNP
jgi:(p)ppGpp synthase/HD superfamily hydrolase